MKRKHWLLGTLSLIAALALAVAFAYTGDRSLDSLKPRWAPPPSQFVEIAGMQVHLRDEGPRDDALPIVLLHGTSASLHTWDGWVAGLPDRRVIRFDLPGFGLTGPNAEHDYHLKTDVATVIAVLDHLKIERAVLAGNSLGGQIAWDTAAHHPERIAALILVDSAGYVFKPKSIPLGFRLARNPVLAPVLTWMTPRSMVATSVRNTYGHPERVTEDTIDRYYELTLRAGNRQALIDRFQQIRFDQDAELVLRLKLPTLILWGGRDQLIPPENAERFAREIAGSEVEVFPELGHIPQEEDPKATVAAARYFLETRACAACVAPAPVAPQ